MPSPQALDQGLVDEGHTIPIARVAAMHAGGVGPAGLGGPRNRPGDVGPRALVSTCRPQNTLNSSSAIPKKSRVTSLATEVSNFLQVKITTERNLGRLHTYSEMPESMSGTNAS